MVKDLTKEVAIYRRGETLPDAIGFPWFVMHFLYDGRHRVLHAAVDSWLKIFDVASAKNILVQPIGDPGVQGHVFLSLASPKLLAQVKTEQKRYRRLASEAGGEDHYKEDQMALVAHALRVESESFPCIAFRTTPILSQPPLLSLKRHWIASDESLYRVFDAVRVWLQEDPVARILDPGMDIGEISDALVPELSALSDLIEKTISGKQGNHTNSRILLSSDGYPPDERVLVKQGRYWVAIFRGEGMGLKDSIGMRYIAHLLANPRKPISAPDLMSREKPGETIPLSKNRMDKIDRKALEAYKKRLEDLDSEIAEAGEWNNFDKKATLEEERESIRMELSSSVSRSGYIRPELSDREKIRKAVSKAIRRAYDEMKSQGHDRLLQHLQKHLEIGFLLQYNPDSDTPWTT